MNDNTVHEFRLRQIITDASHHKENAVAECDFEEAALWRDAKQMALELLELREQVGDCSLTREQLMGLANRKTLLVSQAHARWMAGRIIDLEDGPAKAMIAPVMRALIEAQEEADRSGKEWNLE